MLFLLVVTLNSAGWIFGLNALRETETHQFNRTTDAISWWISSRVSVYHVVLRGITSFFQNSDQITLDEWSNYVRELNLKRYYPGVSAFGLTRAVTHAEIPAFTREMNRLYPDFSVDPDPIADLDTHYIVTYVEPYVGREKAIGYDQGTDPERKRLIEEVRDTGNINNSNLITLITTDHTGFFMAAPIYAHNLPLGTVEQRRAAFVGVAFATFRKDEPFEAIFAENNPFPDLDVEVYNNGTLTPEGLLYDSDPSLSALHPPKNAKYSKQTPLAFEEYKWTVVVTSKPEFGMSKLEQTLSYIPLVAGGVLSLVLFITAFIQLRRYKQLLEITEEK
jgi:CHASE1-domain containing sensor protein